MSLNMTVEEKRAKLHDECQSKPCKGCPLEAYSSCDFHNLKDWLIEEMYNVMFPQEQEAGENTMMVQAKRNLLEEHCDDVYTCSHCCLFENSTARDVDCKFHSANEAVINELHDVVFGKKPQEQEASVKEAEETQENSISILDKQLKLDEFCDNRGSCGGCPIWIEGIAAAQECCFFSLDEEVINQMYDCVFGNETQPEPVTESNELNKNNENNEPNDVRPSHYNHNGVELIQSMIDMFGKWAVADFCKLNAIKYIYRDMEKGGATDINKAIWYLNKYKDLVYENS